MAIYAVGDIQGCYDRLRELLDRASFDPAKDRLWCVGDLVNRGPDSLQTLRYLKSLGDAAVCILGNHDLHLLELYVMRSSHRLGTLAEVLDAPDCDELVDWLRHRPLLHHDAALGWCMVHGGLHPAWSLADAKARAAIIEQCLQGENWQAYCQILRHAKKAPLTEPPAGSDDAAIFATAVLTRVRYCSQDGRFNWKVRAGEQPAPDEKPWFAHEHLAWKDDCRVVYGHWAVKGLVADQPHVLGLDSGCVWGGSLSLACLDVEDPRRHILSLPCDAYQPISSSD